MIFCVIPKFGPFSKTLLVPGSNTCFDRFTSLGWVLVHWEGCEVGGLAVDWLSGEHWTGDALTSGIGFLRSPSWFTIGRTDTHRVEMFWSQLWIVTLQAAITDHSLTKIDMKRPAGFETVVTAVLPTALDEVTGVTSSGSWAKLGLVERLCWSGSSEPLSSSWTSQLVCLYVRVLPKFSCFPCCCNDRLFSFFNNETATFAAFSDVD